MSQLRVLIIDDDEHVRRALGRMLRGDETTVMLSDNGPSALAFLADGALVFDAILCDFRMRGMDGVLFYRQLVKMRPDLGRRVVFMSGDAGSPSLRSFVAECGQPVLAKPFDAAALRSAIAQVSASRPTVASATFPDAKRRATTG